MSEEHKNKAELLKELNRLRKRIRKLEQSEQFSKNFETQFKELFEATPVGVFRTTPDGRIIMANPALIKMLGYSSFEELSQLDLEKEGFAQGYPRSAFKELIERDGKVAGLESAWIKRDGTALFIIENARAIRDESGKTLYYEGIVQDITEHKKVEQALIESNKYANSLLDAAPEAIAIIDLNGRIQQVNNVFESNSGRKREELIGKTLLEIGIMPEDEFQRIKSEVIPRLINEGYVRNFETIATRTDGTKAYTLLSFTLLKNIEDKPIGVITVGRDITDQKQAEDELRWSEKKYRDLVEEMNDIIYTLDTEGNVTSVNKAGKATFGREPEEVLGKSFKQWIPKENLPDAMAAFKRILGGEKITAETVMLDKNGKPHNVEFSSTAIIKDRKVVGTRGTIRDITERRKAEEDLRKNRERLEYILSTSPATTYTCKVGGDWPATFISENVRDQFGYEPHRLIEDTNFWPAHIHPDDRQRVFADLSRLIDSNFHVHEYRFLHKDGQYRWVHDELRLIRDKESRPIECIGYWMDITERKKAEQWLRESEEKFRQVVSTSTDAIMLFDAETRRFVEVNKACEKLYGYRREEFLNLKHSDITAEREKSNESIEKTLEGKLYRVPVRYHRKKDGTVFPVEISTGTFDLRGRRILCGVARDITERLKAEEQIRKLSSAVEQSIDGIALLDLDSKLLYVNEAFARMHDYTPAEIIGMPVTKLHDKEQMEALNVGKYQVRTKGSWEGEIWHIKKDGVPFPTYMSITVLKDAEGQLNGILAVARDITESKRREKELENYRQKLARTEQLASLGTLGAGLAHELSQPLTIITLSIENMLTELEATAHPGTVVRKLRDVLTEVSKLASITQRFRDAARKSSERAIRQIDLKDVAERILMLFAESARRAKISLRLEGIDRLSPIYLNEEDLEQLFFALVDNAIQAADGVKNHRLTISGAVKDKHIELRFSDNCGGIPPENLNKIFEPFFTTKPADQATGLGLCIAEHIVSRAGGKIHVESKLGEGTTFYIKLPVNIRTKS